MVGGEHVYRTAPATPGLLTSFDLVCRYLSTCSRGGINFNKQKFMFAKDTVDYVGFTLTRDEIKPAAAMTESIRNFPAPQKIEPRLGHSLD